jgi:hypothetical protein
LTHWLSAFRKTQCDLTGHDFSDLEGDRMPRDQQRILSLQTDSIEEDEGGQSYIWGVR